MKYLCNQQKLEQLERLWSEDTPHPAYPYYFFKCGGGMGNNNRLNVIQILATNWL